MAKVNAQDFLVVLREKYPNVLNRNKRFWNIDFVKEMNNFIQSSQKTFSIQEEIDPHKIDRCPNCHIAIVAHDNYCSNCGSTFRWS